MDLVSNTSPEFLQEQQQILEEAEKRKKSQKNQQSDKYGMEYSQAEDIPKYPQSEQYFPMDSNVMENKVLLGGIQTRADVHVPPKQVCATKPMYRQSEPVEDDIGKGKGLNPVYEYNKKNQGTCQIYNIYNNNILYCFVDRYIQ